MLEDHAHWLKELDVRPQNFDNSCCTLKGVLKPEISDNFTLLSMGVFILANSDYCLRLNNLAQSILVSFVEHFGQLYGQEFLVYNIHGLVHLCDDV